MDRLDWANFLRDHRIRHPAARLPDPDTESGETYYRAWIGAARRAGIHDRRWLDLASERMVIDPPKPSLHVSTLLRFAADAQREAGVDTVATDETRETAELASRNCPHCCGDGLATVHHEFGGDPEHKIPAVVAAYCVCRMGRWVRSRHAVTCPDVRKRTPDLEDALQGRSVWQASPPHITSSRD